MSLTNIVLQMKIYVFCDIYMLESIITVQTKSAMFFLPLSSIAPSFLPFNGFVFGLGLLKLKRGFVQQNIG